MGLPDGWIERRTGIRNRPVLEDDRAMSDLAIAAGRAALEKGRVGASDIQLLLLASSTPDHLLPPTAPLVSHRLGLGGGGVDLMGACTGFLYALSLAAPHACRHPVLVIAANVLSRRVRPGDAATNALFADAAGAAILEPKEGARGIRGSYFGADGSKYEEIHIPAGGSREPMTAEAVKEHRHLMEMERGPAFFRSAVEAMIRSGRRALDAAGIGVEDVDWWIPHQANARLTRRSAEGLGIPEQRTIDIIAEYGNSSAATIPLALALANQDGRLRRGDTLLLTAVGAGLLEAGLVVQF